MKVAIPRLGDSVAPCFEYSATFAVFTIDHGHVVDQTDLPVHSREPLDRVRLLRDQHVDTIICGGVQDVYEDLLSASGVCLVTWVTGNVDDLLQQYLEGRLTGGKRYGLHDGPRRPDPKDQRS